jgi:cation transport protein ChaC
VVTLIRDPDAVCTGMAYRLDDEIVAATFERLDHREKNGYERHAVELKFPDSGERPGLVYIAAEGNFAYAGEACEDELAQIIAKSHGPSGANREYLYELADALRSLHIDDPHVFELEALVRKLPNGD